MSQSSQVTGSEKFYRSIFHDLGNNLGAIHLIAAALAKSIPVVIKTNQQSLASGSDVGCTESVLKELPTMIAQYDDARQKIYDLLMKSKEYLSKPEAEMQAGFSTILTEITAQVAIVRKSVDFLLANLSAMRNGYEHALEQNLILISKTDKLQMVHFEDSITTVNNALISIDEVLVRKMGS